jgi:excisionase family DNA binding protein
MDQEIMTVEDIAKYLRLTKITVYKLLKEGKIPGYRIGGSWRVNKKELLEMIGKEVIE